MLVPSLYLIAAVPVDTAPEKVFNLVMPFLVATEQIQWMQTRARNLLEFYLRDAEPLSPEQKRKIQNFAVPFTRHKITIDKPLIMGLMGTAWLNDEIIDVYLMDLLVDRDDVTYCSVLFLYQIANKLTPTRYDFTRDLIIVPINYGNNHWALGVIYPNKSLMQVYDSCNVSPSERKQNADNFAETMISVFASRNIHKSIRWNVQPIYNSPTQTNSYDCGVFMVKIAEALIRGREVQDANIIQSLMPIYRQKMAYDLVFPF